MKRHSFSITGTAPATLKQKILRSAPSSAHFSLLDSNGHHDRYTRYEWLAAWGGHQVFELRENVFPKLKKYLAQNKDWLFGHLSYELKNEVEMLQSGNPSEIKFAPALFFVPRTVVYCQHGEVRAESLEHESEAQLLAAMEKQACNNTVESPLQLRPHTSQKEYLQKVASLKEHLQYGNIYEINYCVEFSAVAPAFAPVPVFERLNKSARAPFSAFYRAGDHYLLCTSPERYLQKNGDQVISQPIKGTARRSPSPEEDEELKTALARSEKERSENVMITDLVRNDLSRTAARGSVKVEELFGIYSFPTVHQMITTVSSELDKKYGLADLLQTTFPMGSMTGAPKVKAMQLIEGHENFSRNLYAGSVGYIDPQGNADFNVVIRSLFYNASSHCLSARVGSAITILCEAESEYEECLLKAENLFKALQSKSADSGEER